VKKNVPINKGNYNSMEAPERIALFEKHRGEGWEEEYKAYRERWEMQPKQYIVGDYPVQVDIEISNVCNLNCPMCFRGKEEYKEKYKDKLLMNFELFKKIIDEIGKKVPAVRLSLRGESTLHPKMIECIKYAKEKGIKEVSFLTNGSKLTKDYFKEIMLAGADWITISVDGTEKTYESIRKPLKFKETLERIKKINEIKQQYNYHKPVIKIQSIWPAIKDNPEEFFNIFAPYVDLIAFNPLIDYLANDDEKNIIFIEGFSCPQHYQRLVIGADGMALMCTNDEENTQFIGDANKQSIHEIWNGERLNKIRELHKKKNGFKKIPVCKACFLPRKTESIETGCVNGRVFTIENYINRTQEIGK